MAGAKKEWLRYEPSPDGEERATLVACVRLTRREVNNLKALAAAVGEKNWLSLLEGLAQRAVADKLG